MERGTDNPRYSGELLKHMDKQNEVLVEARKSMLHELEKLQVEEEMLMRKLYEVMSAHGLTKQNDGNSNTSYNTAGTEHSNEVVNAAHKGQ
ncbi:uncharacterized protein LOC133314040 [Gastrolobium bilobum]|uniref:uncharacterized protein LOC133314040 n=1 Tax=Gastrolobium bilobum TaxID=150636 RepID=UPI002AAF279D|nr:uncharacterized protein LOC133314040 [Gastrolobium bilobum]XP_061371459.1 uncharacterized protein LOC133314040 [Gastrolobium bilobum]XP_061371460.1 uncharacterized protein LOC133314040 [Gastrolobium bilobum]XP_061371461.1 uncharacterized protein LOC133314040 [Gastrolobium bilobum]